MHRLQHRSAIITGATSGMGRATARLFAREGAAVVAGGRDGDRGRSLVDEIREEGGTSLTIDGGIMTGA